MKNSETFLGKFINWAACESSVIGAVLVGSHARGSARADSDIDIVIITQNSTFLLEHNEWIEHFGEVSKLKDEDWGAVQARRVFYKNGVEIEFGITIPAWLETNPIDPGTEHVMKEGYKILIDKSGLLSSFAEKLSKR
jgi:uncharacterized protein